MSQRIQALERHSRGIPLILKLDKTGAPVKWVTWSTAVKLEFNSKVLWRFGTPIVLCGGERHGAQSTFDLSPVIACNDRTLHIHEAPIPALTNVELFRRDDNLCLYCGEQFKDRDLSRDHIIPVSRGGKNTWSNVVTACLNCNMRKSDRLPEEAGMLLLAVPYVPNMAELLLLQNRRIVADQHDFLLTRASASYKDWSSRLDTRGLHNGCEIAPRKPSRGSGQSGAKRSKGARYHGASR